MIVSLAFLRIFQTGCSFLLSDDRRIQCKTFSRFLLHFNEFHLFSQKMIKNSQEIIKWSPSLNVFIKKTTKPMTRSAIGANNIWIHIDTQSL